MTTLKPLALNTAARANNVANNASAHSHSKSSVRASRLAKGIGVLTGLAALLTLTPAFAQTQYALGTINFTSNNQSMWSSGDAWATAYNVGLTKSWNTGSVNKNSYKSVPVLGTFGAEVAANSSGTAGINLSAWATAGGINIGYQVRGGIGVPASIKAGQSFNITSGWNGWGGKLSTQSPQFGVQVDSLVNGSASTTLKAKAFNKQVFSKSPGVGMNWGTTLVHLDSSNIGGDIDVAELGILTGSGHVPLINTNTDDPYPGGLNTGYTLRSSGADNFLTLNGDITKLMTTILGWGSFKYDSSQGVTLGSIDFGYNFLDLYGTVNLTAQQDFSFSATPKATVTFLCGNNAPYVVSVPLGSTIPATLPVSFVGPVTVKTSIDINTNTLSNNTSLIVNPGLYFLPMEAYVGGKVASHSVYKADYTPISPLSIVEASVPISVYNKSFTLGGFGSQTLPTLTMTVTQ